MGKDNPVPEKDSSKQEATGQFQSEAGTLTAAPPPFQLQAGTLPIQRQDAGATGTVQERFANHTLTRADLTEAYVVEQFTAMGIPQLFEYRRQCSDADVKAHILTLIDSKERDPYNSYIGKQFTISDANATIRDEAGAVLRYAEGDTIPTGKRVGDAKVIPNGTVVYITRINDNATRVYAEDWGWTNIGNIDGRMFNETMGIDRAEHQSTDPAHKTVAMPNSVARNNTPVRTFPAAEPRATIPQNTMVTVLERVPDDSGNVKVRLPNGTEVWTRSSNISRTAETDGTFKVTDPAAVIRVASVEYPSTGVAVPQGERVIVLAQSTDTTPAGQYVQIGFTKKDTSDQYVRDEDRAAVWVAAADLVDNWGDFKSDNARWRAHTGDRTSGVYLGQMDVVRIVGRDTSSGNPEVEKISPALLQAYNELRAAAATDGHNMILNSGWRSYPDQQELWNDNPNPARVARPGRSNHQNGIAIDINTGGFGTAMYNWMKANGPGRGWIRTVNGEDWHWELRPADAAAHGYKMPGLDG